MAVAKAEILDAISSMSVLELSELIKEMEEKFGVSAAAAAVSVAAPAAGGGAADRRGGGAGVRSPRSRVRNARRGRSVAGAMPGVGRDGSESGRDRDRVGTAVVATA